jgi:hypothetical protein
MPPFGPVRPRMAQFRFQRRKACRFDPCLAHDSRSTGIPEVSAEAADAAERGIGDCADHSARGRLVRSLTRSLEELIAEGDRETSAMKAGLQMSLLPPQEASFPKFAIEAARYLAEMPRGIPVTVGGSKAFFHTGPVAHREGAEGQGVSRQPRS